MDYRRVTRDLIRQVRALRSELADFSDAEDRQADYYAERAETMERSMARARRETEDARRDAEADRWYREDELRRVTRDLERAASYDDEWGQRRALDTLKRLGQ